MNKGISVIICCYNSETRLPETIKHIVKQNINEGIKWELIIIDNNSSDDTNKVAQFEWGKYELDNSFKIITESQQGLVFARNRGVQEAKYDILIFCDDDNWLDVSYLKNAYKKMIAEPTIGALGGQSNAVSDLDFPEWFEELKGTYAVGTQANSSGFLTERLHLWGAGMVTRKTIIKKVFSTPLLISDRNKDVLTADGDSEICARILLMKYRLYYDEELKYTHYISKNRLALEYKERMFNGFRINTNIVRDYYYYIGIIMIPQLVKLKTTLRLFLKICFSLFQSNETRNKLNPIYKERIAALLLIERLTKNDNRKQIIRFINSI